MADEERSALWMARVAQWRASGLTQAAFARQEGICKRRLNYWITRPAPLEATATLVPIRVKADKPEYALQLISASGWRLMLSAEVPAAWLSEVLQRLG